MFVKLQYVCQSSICFANFSMISNFSVLLLFNRTIAKKQRNSSQELLERPQDSTCIWFNDLLPGRRL